MPTLPATSTTSPPGSRTRSGRSPGGRPLSTDTTTDASTETRSGLTALRGALVALAIGVLVAGAAFLGGRTTVRGADVAAAIEAGDAEAVAEALVLEAVPGLTADQALQVIQQQLAGGMSVTSQRAVSSQGTGLTEVQTDAGLTLCEAPNGRVLINCLVARAAYTWDAGAAPFAVEHVGGEVYPGEIRLDVLIVAGDEPLEVDGQVQVVSGDSAWQDVTVTWFPLGPAGLGEPLEAPFEVPAGQAVVLRLSAGEEHTDQLLAGDLSITVDGSAISVELDQAQRFLD